jgi:hypothetical protein
MITALIPLAVLAPALAMNQRSRIAATAVAAAYYGVSSFPVAQISAGYFGRSDVLLAILLWAVAGAILAPGVGWPSGLLIVQAEAATAAESKTGQLAGTHSCAAG